MAHSPYSPDLAPFGYYLFRIMSNELAGEHFDSEEAVKNWLEKFFDSKPKSYYERGIRKLPVKWAEAVNNNENYLE